MIKTDSSDDPGGMGSTTPLGSGAQSAAVSFTVGGDFGIEGEYTL